MLSERFFSPAHKPPEEADLIECPLKTHLAPRFAQQWQIIRTLAARWPLISLMEMEGLAEHTPHRTPELIGNL